MNKTYTNLFFLLVLLFLFTGVTRADELAENFRKAPASLPGQKLTLKGMPLWHMNGPLTSELIQEFFEKGKASGFAGYTILPMSATQPKYLSEEYFKLFGEILETAEKMEMKIVFYDDVNFPSGTAGGKMQTVFPEDTLKRLDKVEWDFQGPGVFSETSPIPFVEKTSYRKPGGVLMSAVAMNMETKERIDLRKHLTENTIRWTAPTGNWKIMLFLCVDAAKGLVDYLCPESTEKYLTITYDEFYKRFEKYFGTTIPLVFYDDLSLAHVEDYRTWTPAFNAKFETKYGKNPELDYPALWYDIGPETTATRCALFGFRNTLFSEGHMRVIHEWCQKRNVLSSGHPMGPYIIQPVDMGGDNFLFHKHSDVTLFDSIHYYGHGRDGFKIPTSASYNYDRPITAVEIYGNYPDKSVDRNMLYRSAMEIFARGGNLLLPHGTWTDEKKMHIPPDIAWKNPRFGNDLPEYGDFVSRCSLLLQGGRHVADIGMVYPIASLTGFYRFFNRPEKTHYGSYFPPETDYLKLSDQLTGAIRRDFTLIHPEIIDEKCRTIKDKDGSPRFRLENEINWEEYPVLLMPGGKVIAWSNLQKIKEFFDAGGTVVATSMLPSRSMEIGHDADVQRTVKEMFGVDPLSLKPRMLHLKIEVNGETIKTSINGHLVDTTIEKSFSKGGIGFRQAPNEKATFANLRVTTPDGKVLLSDDFKGLSQWNNIENATVSDNRFTLGENQIMSSKIGEDWTDYVIECDVLVDKTAAGLTFRVQDSKNALMWQIGNGSTLAPHVKKNGGWTRLKTVQIDPEIATESNIVPSPSGKNAWFLSSPSEKSLRSVLDRVRSVPDVQIFGSDDLLSAPVVKGKGMLQYLHKVKEGRNVYFFANSSDEPVEFDVKVRGSFKELEQWNPHDGTVMPIDSVIDADAGTTSFKLKLPPVYSLFVVEKTSVK